MGMSPLRWLSTRIQANRLERQPEIMVDTFEKIGDALGLVWALFEDESGQLTLPAMVLLAALAFAIATRCVFAILPAKEANFGNVVGVGSGIALVVGLDGVYFGYQIISVALH